MDPGFRRDVDPSAFRSGERVRHDLLGDFCGDIQMARRKKSGIDIVAAMPWQAGVVLGVVVYLGIRYGIGWYFSSFSSAILKASGQQLSNGVYAPLAWLMLIVCWIGAAFSYFERRKRQKLLETQTGLNSITAMSWREFETLVGEAFRRRGYSAEETGGRRQGRRHRPGASQGWSYRTRAVQAMEDTTGQCLDCPRDVGLGDPSKCRCSEDCLRGHVHG